MRASLGFVPVLMFVAGVASAQSSSTPKNHASTLTGTVAAMDEVKKTLVVHDAQGKDTQVVWTGATRMTGGTLKIGQSVTVRWMHRDGKKIATIVKVHDAESVTTASASPTVSPTPKAP
ncbi:MAG TPA: hypothetical protein VEG84_03950 [Thermoanaerobaculia bacterium]|nr:hypothetical protein [Thermoanaerobaculia bacterium]